MPAIHHFHDSRLSLILSAIKHVVGHSGTATAGLAGDHPVVQEAGNVLAAIDAGVEPKPDGELSGVEVCAYLMAKYAWAWLTGNKREQEEIADQYKDSACDPGWLVAVGAYLDYYEIEGKEPLYIDVQQAEKLTYALPDPTGDSLVVGVLGDWGTGEPVAEVVLDQMFEHQKPDVVIHVGDIYYAGTEEEAQKNFLEPILRVRAKHGVQTPVYNLPGNHDYYSGGKGFYKILEQINPNDPQTASFFCLRNDAWQLQGMDTGFFDHDLFRVADDITHLHESEAQWHRDQIAAAGARKVLLFSHHQYFSSFLNIGATKTGNQNGENFNPYLQEVFGDAISQGLVAAWFWGHEHLLEVYEENQGLTKGRCVGYSAFPMLATKNLYEIKFPKVRVNQNVELETSSDVYNHGYVVLTLGADSGTADYYSVPGDATPDQPDSCQSTLIFSERIVG